MVKLKTKPSKRNKRDINKQKMNGTQTQGTSSIDCITFFLLPPHTMPPLPLPFNPPPPATAPSGDPQTQTGRQTGIPDR